MRPYIVIFAASFLVLTLRGQTTGFKRLDYNNPNLVVDLGVGLWAWPLPIDWDEDGDLDLVVVCPDKPSNGVYFFENPTGDKFPVFKPGVRIGPAERNVQISYVDGQPHVLTPATEWIDFRRKGFETPRTIFSAENIHDADGRIRANQWRYVDYNGDGVQDVVVGVGDWTDYGWDDAFNSRGQWTRGPLHGYVYVLINDGTTERPDYLEPMKITAGGKPIDVFGMPSPNFADFDGDGDLDLLCGEFLDGFTYFENGGTRQKPHYASGRRLFYDREPLTMDLQMITPVAIDWDQDGDFDLISGDEDGRVAFIENTGRVRSGVPEFLPARYFRQEADKVKYGALATPVAFDWDGDGDQDLISGNTAGYVGFIENLGGDPPSWAAPRKLTASGKTIRIQAGNNGSIQGPAEAKWGYTTLNVADWDHDGLPDLIVNSIWGKVLWYRNVGTLTEPELTAAQPVEVEWKGSPLAPAWNWWRPEDKELVTQWRTTPVVLDITGDGLNDLVMLDHEGYLALFERARHSGVLTLKPGRRIFTDERGQPLRLNDKRAGGSGRRKLCLTDWNGDGKLDLLVNSINVTFYRNVSTQPGQWSFKDEGPVSEQELAGHTTSPTTVDWNQDGNPDLLIGAEDGFFYYLRNPFD